MMRRLTAAEAVTTMAPQIILIIEDDPMVARALEFVVQDAGYETCVAASAEAAVAALDGRIPALIVSDWRLPGGTTGGDAINRIRALHGTTTPALVLTGESAPEWFRDIQALGLDVFLKPIDLNRLLAAIEASCGPPA